MKSFWMTGNKISKQIIALPLPFTLPRCEVQILSEVTSRNPNPLLSLSKHKAVTHLHLSTFQIYIHDFVVVYRYTWKMLPDLLN